MVVVTVGFDQSRTCSTDKNSNHLDGRDFVVVADISMVSQQQLGATAQELGT
jgi:hypothetical protein